MFELYNRGFLGQVAFFCKPTIPTKMSASRFTYNFSFLTLLVAVWWDCLVSSVFIIFDLVQVWFVHHPRALLWELLLHYHIIHHMIWSQCTSLETSTTSRYPSHDLIQQICSVCDLYTDCLWCLLLFCGLTCGYFVAPKVSLDVWLNAGCSR